MLCLHFSFLSEIISLVPLLGVIAARDATLTFMVGGQEDNFGIAESILENIGKNVVHCGGVGTGQVCIFHSSYSTVHVIKP